MTISLVALAPSVHEQCSCVKSPESCYCLPSPGCALVVMASSRLSLCLVLLAAVIGSGKMKDEIIRGKGEAGNAEY